jgi:PAS domain S-box-containing protein/putative nucleotidyltransferase with HDIG domain
VKKKKQDGIRTGQNVRDDDDSELARKTIKLKRSDRQVSDAERLYRALVEISPDAVIITDLKGKITAVSRQCLRLYGCRSAQDLVGKNAFNFIIHEERTIAKQNLALAMKNGASKNMQYTLFRKDGSTYQGELHANLIRDSRGRPKAFIGILRDVTEQRIAQEALRRSEEKYKTLTENINVGVYRNTPGPKGRFIEVNQALIKMFGYREKGDFKKIDVADLYQDSEDRKRFNAKILSQGYVKNEELYLKKKDGTPFIASVSAVAVRGDNGEVVYYDGIVEDITERKLIEHNTQKNYDTLQRILEETVDALASTLGKRDPYTGSHQKRVTKLACAIAEELGLSQDIIKGINLAGLLHDIGKIAIPAEILSKPSRLTEAEFNIVKDHPQIGYDILKSIEFPWPIADIVLQHHELLDGSGYPRGLKDGNILIEAKIMVVADVVEAMCSHRPYRPAHSLKESLDEITRYRSLLYDSRVVDICLRLFHKKRFRFKDNSQS